MRVSPLLLIMFPRRIPAAVEALHALDVDKVYLSAMYEAELVPVIADIVERHDEYTHFLLISDDATPQQAALDLVIKGLEEGHPIVTAYCNLEVGSPMSNLTDRPFAIRNYSHPRDYSWIHTEVADSYPEPYIPTCFAGAALTGMSREMWQRFPFGVNTHEGEPRGYCSDWNLCIRLQDAGIPIVAPRGAFIEHLKQAPEKNFSDPWRGLLVHVLPPELQWSLRDGTAYIEPMTFPRIEWPLKGAA